MYYGFDIGGTKIALGVFDSGRQLQWEKRVPTPRDSYDAFLDAVCELVAEADRRFGCKGSVGIGIPGMPETEDGTLYAANVPAASGKPLRADLSARLDRDVRLDNSVDTATQNRDQTDNFQCSHADHSRSGVTGNPAPSWLTHQPADAYGQTRR